MINSKIEKMDVLDMYIMEEKNKRKRNKKIKKMLSNGMGFLIILLAVFLLILAFLYGEKNHSHGYYAENPDKNSPIHYVWVEE